MTKDNSKQALLPDADFSKLSFEEYEKFLRLAVKKHGKERKQVITAEQFAQLQEAAKNQRAESQYCLGQLHRFSLAPTEYENDYSRLKQGFFWLEQAALQDFAPAQCEYASNFSYQEPEHLMWLNKAAANNYAEAFVALASCATFGELPELKGKGRIACLKYKIELLEKAYALGSERAIEFLSDIYVYGAKTNSIKLDYSRAEKFLTIMANRNDADACYTLGRIYYAGIQRDTDYAQAFLWMQRSIQAGYDSAKYELATMMFLGQGCTKNQSQAIKLYIEAFEAIEKEVIELNDEIEDSLLILLKDGIDLDFLLDGFCERLKWEVDKCKHIYQNLLSCNVKTKQNFKKRLQYLKRLQCSK